jgi:hypothetical protein
VGKYFDVYDDDDNKVAQKVLFKGTVNSYNATEGYYCIRYEDGDEEDADEIEIIDMVRTVRDTMDRTSTRSNRKKRNCGSISRSTSPDTDVKAAEKVRPPAQVRSIKAAPVEHEDFCLFANHGMLTPDRIDASLHRMTCIAPKDRRNMAEFFLFMIERHKLFLYQKYIPYYLNGIINIISSNRIEQRSP